MRAHSYWHGMGVAGLALGLLLIVPGCGGGPHRLETGYEYQPLNSTPVERRAFYADPHSIEARRAEQSRQQRRSPTSPFPGGS